MNSGFDFSYTSPNTQRNAFRTSFAGLRVIIKDTPLAVNDLSTTGLSFFASEGHTHALKEELLSSLTIGTKIYISNLAMRVARIDEDTSLIGCFFTKLSTQQERGLDKLIVEVQKRIIAQAKDSK